jgi:hypothetical protein
VKEEKNREENLKIAPELRALKFKFKGARVCGPTYERTEMLCVFIYIFLIKNKEKRKSLPPALQPDKPKRFGVSAH